MGTNLMDQSPRGEVLAAGYQQGLAVAEVLGHRAGSVAAHI